jgi:CRISPR/Cas system-associated exonuclease Cas4 (RecB family)
VKPNAWSHTALSQFSNCPKQYYHLKVVKDVVDVRGEAVLWGERVHEAFEAYLKDGKPLPIDLSMYQGYLDAIKAVRGTMYVEHEMALDNQLNPCEKFAKNVFVRGVADVLHVDGDMAFAMDHKTGNRKQDSKQMKLMALLIFQHFPAVQKIKVGFFWLKVKAKDTDTFVRADIPALWQEFLPDIKQFRDAFMTNTWQPRQSGLCNGWCPVTTCDFWKPKRRKQ